MGLICLEEKRVFLNHKYTPTQKIQQYNKLILLLFILFPTVMETNQPSLKKNSHFMEEIILSSGAG